MRRRLLNIVNRGGVESHIILNQNLTDPAKMISGDVNGPAIQWIRQNSHRYVTYNDGSSPLYICQLDDANSNLFADNGSDSSSYLKRQGCDTFMKLPRFFYHAEETSPDIWDIGFSNARINGWKEWDGKDFIGVYETFSDTTRLFSYSGIEPSLSSYETLKAMASVRGGKNYSLVKWKHHSMMAFLFYALYGDTDSQAICGSGTDDYPKTTGRTDALGMTDTVAGGNGDSGSINFWGLENWWGDLPEWIDNVSSIDLVWTITEDDGSTRDVSPTIASGYIYKVIVGDNLDMVPTDINAFDPAGFCDTYAAGPYGTFALIRSFFGDYPNYGIAFVGSAYEGFVPSSGSRLAFRGDYLEISSNEFKRIVS